MTGPTPKSSVRVVPDARTAAVSFFLVSRSWASRRRRSSEELGGELAAGRVHGPGRRDRVQEPGGVSCGDLLGDAARDQLAQHRVQPAGDLVPGAAQVPVPLGPHLQHRGVIIGADLARDRRAQRGDRHRPGVVGVVLVRCPSRQQPHPGAQLGLHVQHPLAGGDSCWASRWPSPPAPSIAQVRSGQAAAHASSRSRLARPRRAPAARPAAPPRRRSPPRCASPCAGRRRSSLLP